MTNSIEIYQADDGKLELNVTLENETVWLTQIQMVELFGRDQSVLSRHIRNVFKDGELSEKSNMQKMHIAGSDKPVAFYSLDVIISVGYRVKSQRGVQFRQWANSILKQHIIEGYTVNQRRLQERGVEFAQAIALLSRTLANQQLVSNEGEAVLAVINDYARSWSLLQGYDEQSPLSN
ncbi:RhuM family protein [Idiomarina sp.]|uniref:virulence RhuM family protein n=1 Tax=Idiomarina sp. TaxID=1874361 RepID=UPI0025C20D42|nr:RhuM family protein [Idiomarina sp.]